MLTYHCAWTLTNDRRHARVIGQPLPTEHYRSFGLTAAVSSVEDEAEEEAMDESAPEAETTMTSRVRATAETEATAWLTERRQKKM